MKTHIQEHDAAEIRVNRYLCRTRQEDGEEIPSHAIRVANVSPRHVHTRRTLLSGRTRIYRYTYERHVFNFHVRGERVKHPPAVWICVIAGKPLSKAYVIPHKEIGKRRAICVHVSKRDSKWAKWQGRWDLVGVKP